MNRSRWILLIAIVALDAAVLFYWRFRREHRFDAEIRVAARENQIPPELIRAVIWQESRFDPEARGTVGELGLMQVTEDAALEWVTNKGISGFQREHLLDPRTNILAGSHYLGKLLRRYEGADNPLPFALADYNAGRGNVMRWLGDRPATNSAAFLDLIGFPSTRAYVESVSREYGRLRPGR